MPDELALRAYRSELDSLRHNAHRAAADIHRRVDSIEDWLGFGGPPPALANLGTDVAALVQACAALKALQDAAYLTEEN